MSRARHSRIGIGILRQTAVDKFSDAGAEMEKQIQAAQQQLNDAQNGRSEAEQRAAVKHLQQFSWNRRKKSRHSLRN